MEIALPLSLLLQRWAPRWRNLTRCLPVVFAWLATAHAQTVWRAELPPSIPKQDAAVVEQLSQRLSPQTGLVQVTMPRVESRNQRDIIARVVSDATQITLIPIASLTGNTSDFRVFDSLFMFKNLEAVDSYTNSIEGKRLLDELRSQGLQGLGFVHGGMVQLASRRPIDASSFLRGLKLGTQTQVGRARQQLATLGLSPVPLAGAASAFALEKGAVDAIEVSWPNLAAVQGNSDWSVLESNHRYLGYVLVVNKDAYDKLSKSSQAQILADAQSVIASRNEQVIAAEKIAKQAVFLRVKTVNELTRTDYDKVFSQLAKPSENAWNTVGSQRKPMAAALAVSDPILAKKYFGDAAPLVAPPRAPQMAVVAPTPVYNIGLSPRSATAAGTPLLQAGTRVTLSFDIGPRKENSVIAPRSPSAEILQSPGDIRLTAVLSCLFCESTDDEVFQQFVYRPAEGRSEEVRFTIVPRMRADGAAYSSTFQLAVTNDNSGRPFDRINVDVAIAGTASARGSNVEDPVIATPSGAIDDSKWQPDIVLHAYVNNDRVTLGLQPVSASMKELLGPLALDAQGRRRVFRTGIDDINLIRAMTSSAFGVMSALSKQGDYLEPLSVEGNNVVVSDDSQKSLQLTDDESRNVAVVIAGAGQSLYRDLIAWSSDADLERLIKRLEKAGEQAANAGQPLRVHVQTNGISLPWQYLHPNGIPVDPSKFWGLKFSLSVERTNDGAPVPSTFPVNPKARKVSFARYTPSGDKSVPYAMEQIDRLRQLPIPDVNLIQVESGADFRQTLKLQRKELSAIIAFLHASSGEFNAESYMQFDNGDRVSARTLDLLRNELTGDELRSARYLTGAPLVILNACETGPARQLPYVSFQDVLAKMGARGVVTTEVSIWMTLGHEVGTRLIARLGKGEAIAEALTAIRRELYAEKKNPLGLLYAYYGDPAATLLKD